MAKVRVSVVKYLNSVPLAWGMLDGAGKDDFEAVFSTPAECAEQLASGAVDVGLIPAIEYQRIPGCRIVPGPAIVSPRRALSVFLLSLVPLFRVESVASDPASRTSEALARIIFAEFYGTRPRFQAAEPVPETMLQTNDAALMIGDVALRYQAGHPYARASNQEGLLRQGPEPVQIFDLAERWNNLTGLPAVFAFWAVRPGFSAAGLRERLVASREHGLANLAKIAEIWAGKLEMEKDFLEAYLEKNLDYHMDIHAAEALRVFYRLAREHGILGGVRDLVFYEDQ